MVTLLENVAKEERPGLLEEGLVRVKSASRVVVFKVNGHAAALLGGTIAQKGVAHVWAVVTNRMRGKGLSLTRLAIQLFDEAKEKYGPLRFFTWSLSGARENERWLNALDFNRYVEIDFEDERGITWQGYLR